jgi:membrane peptidoglycan carboxypeptidase
VAASAGNQNPWPTVGKLIGAVVAAAVLTAGLLLPYVGGLGLAGRHEAAKFLNTTCNLQETQPPQPTTFYASDGKTAIARVFKQDRQPVPLSSIPPILVQALVATEDRRFYSHHGVDMRGLLRSAVSNAGGATQGGSTLTMQYVKQIRYYQAGADVQKQQAAIDQNLNRKIEDAKCALYIEGTKKESKDTILDNYLNIAFFGENAYSVESAAQTYFNKHVEQLTLPESALLVGLLRAPSEYDPFRYPDAAKARRNEVLQNLVAVHDISQADADKYKATPVRLATTSAPLVREGCANANTKILNVGFFCDYAETWLQNVQGITDLSTGGYKVVTTLNASQQNSAQQHLWSAFPATSPMTAVIPAVDPRNGNVTSMTTSKIYGTSKNAKDVSHTVVPNFTNYSASGASTYKLFSLLTALQTGVPDTWTLGTNVNGQGYLPANCYSSTVAAKNGDANVHYNINESLRTATAKSSNTFFVGMDDTLFACDLQPIVDMALKLGMNGLKQPIDSSSKLTLAQEIVSNQYVLPIALGSGLGTSPLELAGAYAAIANGGNFNAPAPILSIVDENGKSISVKRSPAVRVVSPQVAAQAVNILADDTHSSGGTSTQKFQNWYSQGGSIVAGKTGTAVTGGAGTKNAGLWFVGMTPTLTAATAIFNPNGPSNAIASLPGVSNPADNAYGDYASGIWLDSFSALLLHQQWSWADPQSPQFGDPVPQIVGLDVAQAQAKLTAAGYKMAYLDLPNALTCASEQPAGTIAFAGPELAPKGATITVCPSNGIKQLVYKPKPSPTPTKKTPGGRPTRTVTIPGGTGGPPTHPTHPTPPTVPTR